MMTLSEAIRLGATLKPQTRGQFHTPGGRRSCALGAAYEAMGIKQEPLKEPMKVKQRDGSMAEYPAGHRVFYWPKEWMSTFTTTVQCPACPFADHREVKYIIPHLNDQHRWTREQIADFVRSVEARITQPVSTETQAV